MCIRDRLSGLVPGNHGVAEPGDDRADHDVQLAGERTDGEQDARVLLSLIHI